VRARTWGGVACAVAIASPLAWAAVRAAEPSSDGAVSPKTVMTRDAAEERAATEGTAVGAASAVPEAGRPAPGPPVHEDRPLTLAAEAPARDVAAPPPAAPAPAGAQAVAGTVASPKKGNKAAKSDAGKSGTGGLPGGSSDKPLAIRSDELEAVEESGTRNLLFQRNVHVEQGDLVVNSDRLEAHYPPGANQPDRLVATGHVRIKQKDRVLTCQSATYYQGEERLVCVGDADLLSGNDRVRGDQIEIFTSQNRMKVLGRAVVNVTPEQNPEPKKAEATP